VALPTGTVVNSHVKNGYGFSDIPQEKSLINKKQGLTFSFDPAIPGGIFYVTRRRRFCKK